MSKTAVAERTKAPSHTPGPWIVFVAEEDFRILPAGRPGEVAQCAKSPNASLISAAPDLLEMVKLLERTLVYEIKRSDKEGDEEGARLKFFTLAQVREVIAKATAL